tara:strand:+ start:530 stop:772 length:243 start_codon:yes stop_codon:yes gene_type:complete
MKNKRKAYMLRMDKKTYETFQTIANAKGLNTSACIRQALGLFIADNLMMLLIKEAGWEQDDQPAKSHTPVTTNTKGNTND